MKHSYILAGTTFGKITRLMCRNGISFYPAYLLRMLFLLQNGIWASLFRIREKQKYAMILRNHPVPDDPIFIIGHWRSGSTFLHQLMVMDEQMTAPSVFQVSIPDSFLVSRKYYKPVMSKLMGTRRPMDNVKLGFDEPQEDEYALLKLTLDSPLEYLIFPKNESYFLNGYNNFYPEKENRKKWKTSFMKFSKKLDYLTGKRIVYKNPFHSLRIPILLDMFPNARFIHIHRHPYSVVPSTINMWNIVGKQNRLKKKWYPPEMKDVCTVLNRFYLKIREDLQVLPEKMWVEIQFEQFETDPAKTIKKIFDHFGLTFTNDFKLKLDQKLSNLKSYKKNIYSISQQEKDLINNTLKEQFKHFKYEE